MAENKKSFVLYADLIHTVRHLSKEDAGELFMHILSYVSDENPVTENQIVKISFEHVKQQLKRDLIKWEEIKVKRSDAGKISAEKKKQQSATKSTHVESVEQNSTKSTVTVNDNVNVTVNDNNRNTLSHEKVVSETVDNEIFCEQSAMTLKADYNVFVAFISERLDEMKITGHSSKYPLGTIKNILIQDFKLNREKEKRSAKKENYGKSTSPTIGRTNEDAIKKFIADNRI